MNIYEEREAMKNSNALSGVSFDPEKRAAAFANDVLVYITRAESLCREYDATEEQRKRICEKIITLAKDVLYKESRCISWAITGSGNFPVRRQQKRNAYLNNSENRYYDFINNLEKLIKRITRAKLSQAEKAEQWAAKAKGLRELQEKMKADNAKARKEGKEPPFSAWALSNNLANIKRLESQVETVKRMAEKSYEEIKFSGGIAKYDPVEIRWNITFDDIPAVPVRETLKHNGFKWSPRRGAWTRGAKTMCVQRLRSILENI